MTKIVTKHHLIEYCYCYYCCHGDGKEGFVARGEGRGSFIDHNFNLVPFQKV